MSSVLGIVDLLVIGCMLVISASIGIYFRFTGGRQKSLQEFLMGGNKMQVWPVAFSLMATNMSAISVLGLPTETYLYGTQMMFLMVGTVTGGLIAAYGFLPVFCDMNVSTAYEYLEKRFGKLIRTITSLLFTVQMILYMAVVVYAPSLALNTVTGLPTWTSVLLLSTVCTFYSSLGGLKAVLWTDVFQSLLMYITIISVVVAVGVDLGFRQIFHIAEEGGRLIFLNFSPDLTERYTVWNITLYGIFFNIHMFGANQAQVQRLLSVGSLKKAQTALFWSIPLILTFSLLNFADGIAVYAMFHDCDPMLDPATKLSSPDQLLPHSILKLFGSYPGVTGLCIAGVFSASLSTTSSAVNSMAAVTIEDYIRPYCSCASLTESRTAILAKFLTVIYCVITLLVTYIASNFRGVVEACGIVLGIVSGPVLGVYCLGMFSTTANEKGTLVGLLTGFSMSAWLGFGAYATKYPVRRLPQSIVGCSSILNTTINNASAVMNTDAFTLLKPIVNEERYIFPPYKISFPWIFIMGCLVVLIVGYVSSFLISFCMDIPEVDPRTLSPFFRKVLVKTTKTKKLKAIYPEMAMNSINTKEQ